MQHADGRAGAGSNCEASGNSSGGSESHVGWTQLALRNLSAAGPVPVNSAIAIIMPLVPWSYVVRQGGGSVFRAARSKLHRLKQQRQVAVVDSVVTVPKAKELSGIERCIDMLNTAGQCDVSKIWTNKKTAQSMINRMKRLGWISRDDAWPVVTFIGETPAVVSAYRAANRPRLQQG